MFDLYLITPELPADQIEHAVARALEGAQRGRVALQLRAKHLDSSTRRALGERLRMHTRDADAAFLVSGELALCAALEADGVQLPERGPSVQQARAALPSGALVGASRHDLEGVLRAQDEGASFVTLSPICASPGKGQPLGFAALERITGVAKLPVLALGGLGPADAPRALAAGAHGVAMIRSVLEHADPASAVVQLLTSLDAARAHAALR